MSLMDIFFGKPDPQKSDTHKQWRDAIHDNKDAAAKSQGAARLSKRASDEALRVAQCAVKLLENTHKKDGA